MPGKIWIKPLIASGLLIGFMQNSVAGWDCQPSPEGKWICHGTVSPPKTTIDQQPSPVISAGESQRREQTADIPATRSEIEQAPQQAEEKTPTARSTARAVPAAEPTPVTEPTQVDQPATETRPDRLTDKASGEEYAKRKKAAPTDQRPPTAPATTAAEVESVTSTPVADKERSTEPTTGPAEPIAAPTEQRDPAEASQMTALISVDANIDRGLNWNQCYPWTSAAPLSFEPAPAQQMLIDADGSVLEQTKNQVTLEGNVQVRQAESYMEADSVLYKRNEETLDAEGDIYLEQSGLRLTAAKAHLKLASDQGELEQVSYRLSDWGARGDADTATYESRDLYHFKNIDYTTCAPGDNAWLLEASELDIDQASGVGTAYNAKLRFMGVPFLYLPYASFPIDERRKSGFLVPSIGESDRSGAELSVPYYFNIAPNMDATLTPRIMSKRGVMLGGEFRYLQEKHEGEIRAEILPDDRESEDHDGTRGAFSMQASANPAPGWRFDTDINYVSDNDYLDDLSNSLAVTSARHLERVGQIRYSARDWSLLGRTQYFQTIDEGISLEDRPYSRLPQLLFELDKPRQALGLTYQLRSEYVHFEHSDNDIVKGHRFDLQPAVSLPLSRSWGYVTPKASLRYTRYDLENQTPGADNNPDRLLPTFSLDSGLFFERNSSWFGQSTVQTLEPRLFYLLTPYKSQDDLPNFDTSDITFSFPSLFQENRFSGTDKIGDANQLTTALTSRILSDQSGVELLRASIGQIFYFRDRKVQLESDDADDESSSSIIAELASQISREWSMRAGIQWDPHVGNDSIERGLFSLRYNDGGKRIFNTEYNYTRDEVEQTDISARWPLSDRWNLVGRWTFSHLFNETVQALAGIEYDSCCWRVRLIGQQLLTDVDNDPENAILVQFQLKGLGGWGDASDEFLEDNIRGYQTNR